MNNGQWTYFITVYGSQRSGNRPKFSHTFATFTEKSVLPDNTISPRDVTISWLPRDGKINPLGPPEPGRNYTLTETFAWLDQAGSPIRWASAETEIQPRLFESAVDRVNELQLGTLKYVMIDNLLQRPHHASNCIHAVSDLPVAIEELGMAYTGVLHGICASRFVYQYLSHFYVKPLEHTAEAEQIFEQQQRDHFRIAAALESLVDAHE